MTIEFLSGIDLMLPFALDDFGGPHRFPDSAAVIFEVLIKEQSAAEYDIYFARFCIPMSFSLPSEKIRLYPDNLGITAATKAYVYLPFTIEIARDNLPDKSKIIASALEYINPLLDCYSLASGNFGIRSISSSDLLGMQLFRYSPDNLAKRVFSAMAPFDLVVRGLPDSADPDTSGDLLRKSDFYRKLSPNYLLAYRLYCNSRRAFVYKDLKLSAIQAMMALEVAIPFYIEAMIKEKKDEFGKHRVSLTAYNQSRKNISFSFLLKSIFPLLVPDNVKFPKIHVDACDQLRKKRNDAVHNPIEFNHMNLLSELDSVDELLRFLILNHPSAPVEYDEIGGQEKWPGSAANDDEPRDTESYKHRAQKHLNEKKYELAIRDCNAGLSEDQNSDELYLIRAQANRRKGEFIYSRIDLIAALHLKPGHLPLLEELTKVRNRISE